MLGRHAVARTKRGLRVVVDFVDGEREPRCAVPRRQFLVGLLAERAPTSMEEEHRRFAVADHTTVIRSVDAVIPHFHGGAGDGGDWS